MHTSRSIKYNTHTRRRGSIRRSNTLLQHTEYVTLCVVTGAEIYSVIKGLTSGPPDYVEQSEGW